MLSKLFAERVKQLNNDEISKFLKLVGENDIISFAGGIPDPKIFPVDELKILINQLVDSNTSSLFQYGNTEGSNKLKEYIIGFLNERNISCMEENLLITTGSQQALDLVSKIFINKGDNIIVENPGYVGGIGAIKSYEANIIGIDVDENGIQINLLEKELEKMAKRHERVKFLYLVPDYSNPSGVRLSLKRRKQLLKMASKYNYYIIEDTAYSELNYEYDRLPSLKELDTSNCVIYLGTFSKFFLPGLRIGWICADKNIINLLTKAKQNSDLASSTFAQELIAFAGEKGLINTQIKKIIPYYKLKLEKMAQALNDYFPTSTSWHKPRGGFFFWIKLPSYINSCKLNEIAFKNKVAFVTGNSFFADPTEGNHYLRLSFSNTSLAEIEKGLKILGRIIIEWDSFNRSWISEIQ